MTRDPGLCSSQPPGSNRPFAGFEGQWESPGAVKSCQGLCTSCPLPQLLTTHLKCSRQGHLTQGQAVGAKAVKLVCQLYYYRANHKDIQERHTMCTQTHAHRHRCETDPCHLQRPCEDPKSICTQGTLALWHLPRAWPPPTITLHKHFSLEGCPQAQGGPQAVCVVRKLTGATHGHRALLALAAGSWGIRTVTCAELSVGPRLSVPRGHHQAGRRTSPGGYQKTGAGSWGLRAALDFCSVAFRFFHTV